MLGYDYTDCAITDESVVLDFLDMDDREAQVQALRERLRTAYGLDAEVAGSTRIVDLLELVATQAP